MINNSGIVCRSKTAALAALQAIAESLKGTQKSALVAICCWIEENLPPDFTPETRTRIQRVYEDLMDEGNQKAIEWFALGGTPKPGTRIEVPYIFDAVKKEWTPEKGLPPVWIEEHYLPQTDEPPGDEEEA